MNKFKEIFSQIRTNAQVSCPFCSKTMAISLNGTTAKCYNHLFNLSIMNYGTIMIYYQGFRIMEDCEFLDDSVDECISQISNLSARHSSYLPKYFISNLVGLTDQEIMDRLNLIMAFQ